MLLYGEDVVFIQHDVEVLEIASEAAHLHVVALSDDDDVVALAGKRCDGVVRHTHKRARGFDDGQPESAGARQGPLRRAVSRHHHDGCVDVCGVVRDRNAPGLENAQDSGIVHELTENRKRAGVRVRQRERDGVSYAEAHAEMGRPKDTHTREVLYTEDSAL